MKNVHQKVSVSCDPVFSTDMVYGPLGFSMVSGWVPWGWSRASIGQLQQVPVHLRFTIIVDLRNRILVGRRILWFLIYGSWGLHLWPSHRFWTDLIPQWSPRLAQWFINLVTKFHEAINGALNSIKSDYPCWILSIDDVWVPVSWAIHWISSISTRQPFPLIPDRTGIPIKLHRM